MCGHSGSVGGASRSQSIRSTAPAADCTPTAKKKSPSFNPEDVMEGLRASDLKKAKQDPPPAQPTSIGEKVSKAVGGIVDAVKKMLPTPAPTPVSDVN